MPKESRVKPAKPSDDYPLFPHDSGKWAKKIKGKLVYFGRWDDPDGALIEYELYLKPKAPVVETKSVLSVAHCCNHYLSARRKELDANLVSPRTFNDDER